MVSEIYLKQGEGKTLIFTIKDKDGNTIDVTGTDVLFMVKDKTIDETAVLEKGTSDFDFSEASNGVLKLKLTPDDTNIEPQVYVAELKVDFGSGVVMKSDDIVFTVKEAVTP